MPNRIRKLNSYTLSEYESDMIAEISYDTNLSKSRVVGMAVKALMDRIRSNINNEPIISELNLVESPLLKEIRQSKLRVEQAKIDISP